MLNLFGQRISRKGEILGCDSCPSNDVPGIRKIKGLSRIHNQKAFLWAQSPGAEENRKGLELVGASGNLLWRTIKPFRLSRSDFAIQNVMRCQPIDKDGRNRDPDKRELLCCSVYNDEALRLNAGSAVVHVILGDVAGKQLLSSAFKKDKPVFWYDPWDAYVILSWHPSYILRQGAEQAGWEYLTWRDRFRAVRAIIDHPGRFGYLKSQENHCVRTHKEFDEMEKYLYSERDHKRRISFDIEDGVVNSKRVMLIAGFGGGHYKNPKDYNSWTGRAYSVVLDHPGSGYDPVHAEEIRARTRKLIQDKSLKKALQNGSYDKDQSRDLLDAKLDGYDYDTQYGTYLRYSFLKSCSLENLTYRFFPEFCDYKDVVEEWNGNFADAPIDRLTLRNCGDLHITKRLEERFSPQVPYALMQVYIHAGQTLNRMEQRGPVLDWIAWKKAKAVVPKMMAQLDRQLQQITGIPDFNARSADQVAWLVYDHLKLHEQVSGEWEHGRSTNKIALERLQAETGNKVLDIVMKRRALGVIDSTFLASWKECANENEGQLRTHWFLTGAVTGRLRSGGGEKDKRLNLQNVHGNSLLQNLITSDVNWRKALEE